MTNERTQLQTFAITLQWLCVLAGRVAAPSVCQQALAHEGEAEEHQQERARTAKEQVALLVSQQRVRSRVVPFPHWLHRRHQASQHAHGLREVRLQHGMAAGNREVSYHTIRESQRGLQRVPERYHDDHRKLAAA